VVTRKCVSRVTDITLATKFVHETCLGGTTSAIDGLGLATTASTVAS
jgi:hypothetical protein